MSNVLTSEIVAGLNVAGISATNPPSTGNGSLSITKTTSGVQTLLAAVDNARMITAFLCEATETYANNGGTQATWSLGETGNATRWDGNAGVQDAIPGSSASAGVNASDIPSNGSNFTAGALGTVGCILAANKAIIVTCTAAVGAGTGGCKLVVLTVDAP